MLEKRDRIENPRQKPTDLVQVLPMSAYLWKDVEKILIPPQTKVRAHDPIDLRLSRWEL